jgi:hypothetical protein
MADEPIRYAVLLRKPEQLDFPALAAALARRRGCPTLDAMREARSCWGIIREGAEESAAQEEAEALSAGGFEAFALPQNLLYDLPSAIQLARVEQELDQAVFFGAAIFKREATQTITMQKDISLADKALQVGLLMATGLPVRTSRMSKEVAKTVSNPELWGALDIVLQSPARRFRVLSESFDYSCLKEEKAYDTLSNFRTLARRLAGLWPEAERNRGLRFILEGKPQREMGYESLADLERESRWLLTLRVGKL